MSSESSETNDTSLESDKPKQVAKKVLKAKLLVPKKPTLGWFGTLFQALIFAAIGAATLTYQFSRPTKFELRVRDRRGQILAQKFTRIKQSLTILPTKLTRQRDSLQALIKNTGVSLCSWRMVARSLDQANEILTESEGLELRQKEKRRRRMLAALSKVLEKVIEAEGRLRIQDYKRFLVSLDSF